MFKKIIDSLLGKKNKHRSYSSSDYRHRKHSYSSSDYNKRQGYGHQHYKRKRKSRSFFSSS
ncbi:hypothetical protein [Bacillus gaemokensis]|uniref:Uncharacterized protein n=1 Tax=Bacillus gaemokensis TaxID=574375 RepID=A0A073K9T4_9BACI|nr:hypothetical protein [Bacillus gaemokensis]KEK24039.1 hypothetical protein BAGA_04875 [Bacillus gaemokensis]KYG27245.1 hypothetical protein AZF08_16005 [Bacillus gaemokensis]